MPDIIARAEAREKVIGVCDVVREGDWDRLADYAHPGGVLHITDTVYLNGFENLGQFFDYYLEYYDLDYTNMEVTTDGREAAAEITLKITYKKDKPGMPRSVGQTTELPLAVFLVFSGDRISHGRLTFSLDEWMKAFLEEPRPAEGHLL
ncbi:nuclear transport factor 2 family protein [Maritimibacter dapengensis]|uniref:Nuclear transport factor 2 family protein n=1 Tax=Maritimibacter dapengensis TaxID=2836868 RepID=A0ABS6T130_9RHOB|nr:nuclear transport factor 2 family protein [Maritimibacter dapengensis]MBV7378936.1 nuclear transport factor 2 family protein [Maritimibacter dapengensis]